MALTKAMGSSTIREGYAQTDRVARNRQFGWLARAGLAARGLVYGIIGVLALKLALGAQATEANQQGALKTIAAQPIGKLLLILVAIGLAGYASWRLVRAAVGHGREQRDSGMDRVAALASGIAYAVLCATAVEILTGAGSSTGGPAKPTGGVLGWTGGPVLVAIAGVALLGVAGYQAFKGLKKKFLEDSKTEQMSHGVRRAFTLLGVFGHLARTVIFALIGIGLIRAAIDFNPHQAVGVDGALAKLAHASYGPWLLGLVAVGLIGFALYSMADARYRRV